MRVRLPLLLAILLWGSSVFAQTVMPTPARFGDAPANEPAAWNLGANPTIASFAHGSLATPITNSNPTTVFQTWRTNSGFINAQFNSYHLGINGNQDSYNVYALSKFKADLTGLSGVLSNTHGVRGYVILGPTNVGDNHVIGYGVWAQAERFHPGTRAVGLQTNAINSTTTDADSNMGSINSTAGQVNTPAGIAKNSVGYLGEGGSSASAYARAFQIDPNHAYKDVFNLSRAFFTLSGTVSTTGASTAIVGSSTRFLSEVALYDQLALSGYYYTVTGVVDDTHLTITPAFFGNPGSGISVLKPVVAVRLANSAAITARNGDDSEDHRLVLKRLDNVLLLDPDGYGAAFGGAVQVLDSDLNIVAPGKGVILRATNGPNCYRITVNNAGALSTASADCPSAEQSLKSYQFLEEYFRKKPKLRGPERNVITKRNQ